MADRGTAILTPPVPGNGTRATPSARPLRRRRTLPGSRAVVGGLLVTASAVGLFAAYGASTSGPSDAYVVAVREIVPGQRFTAHDLKLVRMDLPAGQRRTAFTDGGLLVRDAVSVNRIGVGELVQSGDVARASARRDEARISVPVEPGNAMGGGDSLEGELVDVIVTYTEGGAPTTTTVARGVHVVDVLSGSSDLGTSGQLTVVLSVDPDRLEDIAGAAAAGKITLAVTTGLRR
ncbi:MAG: hypothetical protein JWO68_1863 [Actinomycetia bacterium]|nr:hypothetical protein [Actinomycetes bacterium]